MALLPQITEDEVTKYLDTTEMLAALDTALGEFSRGEESGVRQPVRSSINIPESKGWVWLVALWLKSFDVFLISKFKC